MPYEARHPLEKLIIATIDDIMEGKKGSAIMVRPTSWSGEYRIELYVGVRHICWLNMTEEELDKALRPASFLPKFYSTTYSLTQEQAEQLIRNYWRKL